MEDIPATPTGERLRKLDNRCITQTVHKLKGQSALEEVSQRTKESGHYRIALNQIGQVLPYSSPDPDGLWIHRSIAEALNAKDAAEMRSGFTCELFNMRGVHGFSAGNQELEIAGRYHKQADALEDKGFHRFATAMRELARGYERDAERESKRDPFED